MKVEKNYVVSLVHITPDTLEWVNEYSYMSAENIPLDIIIYRKNNYGYFIPIDDIENFKNLDIPPDLWNIIDSIDESENFWLMLDRDAAPTPWLEDYSDLYI